MKILLDTHILIWFITDDKRLSQRKSDLIQFPQHLRFFAHSYICA